MTKFGVVGAGDTLEDNVTSIVLMKLLIFSNKANRNSENENRAFNQQRNHFNGSYQGVDGREGGGIPRRKPPWFLLKEPQNFDVIIQFRQ